MPLPRLLLAMTVAAGVASAAQAPEPVVAVAYGGTPAGVPKLEDLTAIRAMGFTGVEWRPARSRTALDELTRLAGPLELKVIPRTDVTIRVDLPRSDLQAALWRAIAKGAKTITLDPVQATGSGLTTNRGDRLPWTYAAATFVGQIAASARLFAIARPGPAVTIADPAPTGVEVALLDGDRAWVLIATNTARIRPTFVARLPPEVPPALWVSLIDGSMMSMLQQPSGPRWTATIEPGAALVFVIDKTPK